MTFRSYKSSPIIKFQKRVRFGKTVERFTRKTFSPAINIKSSLIKTMRLHILPSQKASQILQMDQLTLEAITTMEFQRQPRESPLDLEQVTNHQLDSINAIKSKLKALKTISKAQGGQPNQAAQSQREAQISRDQSMSMSRLYHDQEQFMGCMDVDSVSLEGFDQPTTQCTYACTQNNILFHQEFEFENILFSE